MKQLFLTSLLLFSLFFVTSAQSDLCTSATILTPTTNCSTGVLTGQTLQNSTATGSPSNAAGTTNDVWFRFTTPANITSVVINLSSPGATIQGNTYIEAFTTSNCNSGTFTGTSYGTSTVTNATGTSLSLSGLSPSTLYYFRVFTTLANTSNVPPNKWTFSICVSYTPPPANDVCSAPTNLTPVTSCGATSNQTLFNTTSTGSPANPAGATNDVWYTFTTPANVNNAQISFSGLGASLNSSNTFIEAFSSSNCSAGTFSGTSLGTSASGTSSLTLNNLLPSTQYYFRVFTTTSPTSGISTDWGYSICVTYTPPLANDVCTTATNLTPVTTCGVTSGQTVFNATATGSPVNAAGTTNDVWYTFTTPSGIKNVQISLSALGANLNTANTFIEAFTGSSCSSGIFSGTSLGTSASGSSTLSLTNLSPSTQYYFRVFTTASPTGGTGSNWGFSVCVLYTALPAISGPKPTRMNEVFQETILANNAAGLDSPWELTYENQEDSLWFTENKTYLIRKMSPSTGQSRVILNLSETGSFSTFRRTFTSTQNPWPQGGMMGFVLHPQFLAASNPKNYVYVAYVRNFVGPGPANGFRYRTATNPFTGEAVKGDLFTTYVVRFEYNTSTKALENPVAICDSIPGSNDHNSGRLLIAPVNGTDYLFYSVGDMGAGQFYSSERTNKAEMTNSYEGKILRFNLETDGDSGLDGWIPNDNPYNNIAPVTGQSAVWSIGHRNVQGFVYMNNMLFGSSHGPFSDDEVNVMEAGKHYGHPRIIGYKNDGNYNNARAATATFNGWSNEFSANPLISSLPLITDEAGTNISNYKDPIYSFFDAPNGPVTTPGTVLNMYTNNPANSGWPSIAPSGMGGYTNTKIPGWKNSLVLASLKRGYMMRIKPKADGSGVDPIGSADTSAIFNTQNRFRDLAFDPDGWSIYGAVDRSGSTSGPTSTNPVSSVCPGCIIKYTFKGYNSAGGTSTIPNSIPIDAGILNNCATGTAVTINAANLNSNIWVPLTGPDGNIVAEINANGNDLGNISSSFYVRNGSARTSPSGMKYLNRNINITVQNQPTSPVSVRLYLTATELQDLANTAGSGVSTINDISVFKNSDGCSNAISAVPSQQIITGRYTQSSYGYALQTDISSFSTFYFMSTNSTLPVQLISFTAKAQNDAALIRWTVDNQEKIQNYIVERSINSTDFSVAGTVQPKQNSSRLDYSFTDFSAGKLASVVYYRLKIMEEDGSFKYSQVASVSFGNYFDAFVSIYPNPVRDKVSVLINSANNETAVLKIVDNTGRTVLQRTVVLTKGRNNVELNLGSLNPGVYFADITGKTITQKIKLIKQ